MDDSGKIATDKERAEYYAKTTYDIIEEIKARMKFIIGKSETSSREVQIYCKGGEDALVRLLSWITEKEADEN